jgi:hypothetical protein
MQGLVESGSTGRERDKNATESVLTGLQRECASVPPRFRFINHSKGFNPIMRDAAARRGFIKVDGTFA